MSNMIAEIGDYLVTKNIGALQQNLFLSILPEQPDDCVALFEYAGSPPDLHWDGEYPSLHVKVRATHYQNARSKIESIIKELHGLHETTLGSTRYLLIKAKHSPELYDRDEKGRIILFVNFDIIKEVG